MYGEDIDLSYRIMKSGYKNYFLPSRMLHYKGESTEKSSYRYVYTFYEAMRLFFRKHYAHYSFLVSLPINLAIWARSFMAYFGNQLKHGKVSEELAPTVNMLVIAPSEALEEVKALLAKYHPKGNHKFIEGTEETLSQGHLSNGIDVKGYDYVAYDTENYSYRTILKLLANTPHHALRLATYSSRAKVLITDREVLND